MRLSTEIIDDLYRYRDGSDFGSTYGYFSVFDFSRYDKN
jgi:hypothetical protein